MNWQLTTAGSAVACGGAVPSQAMPVVEVENLVVDRGTVRAVDGVGLSVAAGEVVVILGPNGAGKTTTIETLEGYHRPHSGTVRILGLDPVADHRRLRARVGVMLQRGGIWPGMAPAEALRLFARYYDNPLRPDDLLQLVELSDVADTPWRRLSGGEQQRLALALALVGRPEVALLDEPTAGVDPRGRQGIRDVIAGLRSSGVALMVTTHELDETQRIADRVVILDGGRVVAEGTPDELVSTLGSTRVSFAAAAGIDVEALGEAVAAPVIEQRSGEYVVQASPTPALVAAITAWLAGQDVTLLHLRAGGETLEEVFMRLTSEPPRPSSQRKSR